MRQNSTKNSRKYSMNSTAGLSNSTAKNFNGESLMCVADIWYQETQINPEISMYILKQLNALLSNLIRNWEVYTIIKSVDYRVLTLTDNRNRAEIKRLVSILLHRRFWLYKERYMYLLALSPFIPSHRKSTTTEIKVEWRLNNSVNAWPK